MLELYNEEVNDLLNIEGHNLKIKESPDKGFFVQDLSEQVVHSFEELIKLMGIGQGNRKTSATAMNKVRFHKTFSRHYSIKFEKR